MCITGMIFFRTYLIDFSYYPLKNSLKFHRHRHSKSEIYVFERDVDGFDLFLFLTRIIPCKQKQV